MSLLGWSSLLWPLAAPSPCCQTWSASALQGGEQQLPGWERVPFHLRGSVPFHVSNIQGLWAWEVPSALPWGGQSCNIWAAAVAQVLCQRLVLARLEYTVSSCEAPGMWFCFWWVHFFGFFSTGHIRRQRGTAGCRGQPRKLLLVCHTSLFLHLLSSFLPECCEKAMINCNCGRKWSR